MVQNNSKLSGKLELNWVNKNKTLIVKDYDKGQYECAEPDDYRVSEVRLFKEVGKFGKNSSDNLIVCGDSLNALTSLTKIPEYQQKYVNKVKLIYIHPLLIPAKCLLIMTSIGTFSLTLPKTKYFFSKR